jgi:hypothetical protein
MQPSGVDENATGPESLGRDAKDALDGNPGSASIHVAFLVEDTPVSERDAEDAAMGRQAIHITEKYDITSAGSFGRNRNHPKGTPCDNQRPHASAQDRKRYRLSQRYPAAENRCHRFSWVVW